MDDEWIEPGFIEV